MSVDVITRMGDTVQVVVGNRRWSFREAGDEVVITTARGVPQGYMDRDYWRTLATVRLPAEVLDAARLEGVPL